MAPSLPVHLELIPRELKDIDRWVGWQYRERKGRVTKVPLDPRTGREASCDEPDTWGTLQQAVDRVNQGEADGIGFQLGPPYVGIDLDRCRNPETGVIETWAESIIQSIGSFAEISPSRTGVHIWTKGSLPKGGRRKGHVEIYDRGRYFTVTGQHLKRTPDTIKERQSELLVLHADLFANPNGKAKAGAEPRFAEPSVLTDAQLINRAKSAKNGRKFSRLWAGEWEADYDSQSEADLALCSMLAFWTGPNSGRIDKLFQQSGLYRNKWDERHNADGQTYGQITVDKAIEQPAEECTSHGQGEDVGPQAEGAISRLPVIQVNDRQLRTITDDAVRALAAANDPPALFVRGGHLVQIRSDETGHSAIQVVTEAQLRARLAEISNTVRSFKNEVRDCFPPLQLIENILALGAWPFPPLRTIVEVPVLRPDGSVLDRRGYDAATQLVYSPAVGLGGLAVPSAPSRSEVASALGLVEEMIGEFPFADQPDKANLLATALTPILRPAIPGPTPLALIDAPQAGTGKGLLAEVITLVGAGRVAAMMVGPRDEDEWRKHITAVLSGGKPVIVIDNVEHRLESAPLAAALTAHEWSDRILGLSKEVTVPVRVTWIATGNNVQLGGDIPRRCYRIRLDAKVSRPWKRTGFKHPDLLAWVCEHRGELLLALLSLARAWYAAGKPQAPTPVIGSFEHWAHTVGGVLHYGGMTGFLANLEEMYESSDQSTPQWEAFLQTLATAFGGCCFTVKELKQRIDADPALRETVPDELADGLDKPGSFQRRLGHAFSRRVGTRYGDAGIRVERAGEEKRATKWRVSY